MTERELLAVLAAIIFSGADSHESAAGYTPKAAVEVAKLILHEVEGVGGESHG